MKPNIHPENYRIVCFQDMSNGEKFLVKSTVNTKEKTTIDGVEYPLCKLDTSNLSHPFYTGVRTFVDAAGRIDKFNARYGKFKMNAEKEEAK